MLLFEPGESLCWASIFFLFWVLMVSSRRGCLEDLG
jgi:hypothetical protein